MGIEFDFEGSRATIDNVIAHRGYLGGSADSLCVVVSFEPHLASFISLGINLPPKVYSREELIALLKREIYAAQERDKEKRRKEAEGDAKQKELDDVAAKLKEVIGLS